MRIFWKCLLLTLCAATFSGHALAQNALGRITGSVRDQAGAVIPNATVKVTNEGTKQQIQTTQTSEEGAFIVPQLSPGSYTVKVELAGFKSVSITEVKVDPGQDYSLVVTLEVGQTSEVVTVAAGTDLVNTSNPEISSTVIRRQIVDLPLNGRNPIELVRLQAGVQGLPTRTTTAINGGRPTWTQLTQDGVNIQDNFIRTNSLDFVPNRPTSDTIGEFTITTNTQGADAAGGSSQVKLTTPGGTNEFHGTLYEFNRNSALGANSWFNNATIDRLTGKTVARPFLNRNQFGGNIGGPIWLRKKYFGPLGWEESKDKLFFFFSYEGFRQRTQATQNNVIPAFNDVLSGNFRYIRPGDTTNTVQTINVLAGNTATGRPALALDPTVQRLLLSRFPSASLANNFDVGNSTATARLNTAGFRFLQSDVNDRNQYQMRFDVQATNNHRFEFVHQRFKDTDDRTDLDGINRRPKVFTESDVKFTVGAWRWVATPKLNNELRFGANLAPVAFNSSEDFIGVLYPTALGLTNREVQFQPQGRDTRTFNLTDNASYITGNHSIQFGGSMQRVLVRPYNFAGRFPSVAFGFSPSAPAALQLTQADFPGGNISPADIAAANALRTFLGGIISSVSQTFQVQDKTSGYVAGIPNVRNFTLDNWALYAQDNWRIKSNFTLRYGLKWEYFSPLKEDDNLQLLPVKGNRTPKDALLDPNGTVDFVKGGFYNRDLNNFAPTVGFAWDVFKDGRTSVRGGYSLAFINEETIRVAQNASDGNAGLQSTANLINLFSTVNAGVPVVSPTAFRVPRTYLDQLALGPTNVAFGIDPNLKQPYVHQISLSIEREIGLDMAVEARYVSTLGRDIWRGLDFNQNNAGINQAFLADFLRARSNGFLALNTAPSTPGCTTATCGVFNPAFNGNIPGSQQLSVIPTFGGGSLANANVRTLLQTGQVAGLADFYITNRIAGSNAAFLPNPNIYASNLVVNGATTDYHALQLETRRRFKNGVFGQVNYTFSKVLANSAGTTQARFEPFLDNARPELEKTRADFDITHIINGSMIFELPFGKGRKFWGGAGSIADRVVGGWQVSSIVHYQSGAPISILSGRGTFNRGGRSGSNPAVSSLTKDQVRDLFGIRKLPDGRVFYIDPKVTDPTNNNRGVGVDNIGNTAAFSGQVFFHPSAGQLGSIQRLQFDGPSQASWDFGVIKRVRIKENSNAEFRADFFNFLNSPLFFVGDQNIDSTVFGRITGLNVNPRVVQLALKLNF